MLVIYKTLTFWSPYSSDSQNGYQKTNYSISYVIRMIFLLLILANLLIFYKFYTKQIQKRKCQISLQNLDIFAGSIGS